MSQKQTEAQLQIPGSSHSEQNDRKKARKKRKIQSYAIAEERERKKYICKPGQARNISIKLDEKYSSHFISYFFFTFSSRFIFEMGKTSTTYQTRKQNTNSSSHRDTHELPSLPESLNVCLQLQLLRRSAVSQAGNIPQDFSRRLWGDNRRRGTLTLGTREKEMPELCCCELFVHRMSVGNEYGRVTGPLWKFTWFMVTL